MIAKTPEMNFAQARAEAARMVAKLRAFEKIEAMLRTAANAEAAAAKFAAEADKLAETIEARKRELAEFDRLVNDKRGVAETARAEIDAEVQAARDVARKDQRVLDAELQSLRADIVALRAETERVEEEEAAKQETMRKATRTIEQALARAKKRAEDA